MALRDISSVDAIGIDKKTGQVILTIADAEDWLDEEGHLYCLQEKINAYLEFVESGQVYEAYPQARGTQLVIDIVSRFPPSNACVELIRKANQVAGQLGISVTNRCVE